MTLSLTEEAQEAFAAIKLAIRNLEKDLEDGEVVAVSTLLPGPTEFLLYQVVQHGPLIIVLGHTEDGQAQEIIFSPYQVCFRFMTVPYAGERRPVGFTVEN